MAVFYRLNFQYFFKPRQILRAIGRDKRDVFQPHAADFRIVKPRLDGHDVAWPQNFRGTCSHARRFVDFQTQPVARAVKKSLHAPIMPSGFVALLDKKCLHDFVNIRRRHVRADFFKADFLSAQNRVVSFFTASFARPRTTVRVMSPKYPVFWERGKT